MFAPDPYGAGLPNYDVSLDGQRFVMVAGAESGFGATAQGLVLVENWHQELLERVPIP